MPTLNYAEKRQYPRASFSWRITLISDEGNPIHGSVRNISRCGALLHVETKLQINDQMRFAIEISEFNDVIHGIGRVSRVNKVLDFTKQGSSNTYVTGIQFTSISEADCKYFTGNLANEWQLSNKHLTPVEKNQSSDHRSKKKKNRYNFINLGLKAAGVLGLALLGVYAFTMLLSTQAPSPSQTDVNAEAFNLLYDQLHKEIEVLTITTQKQEGILAGIEKRLSELENSKIILADIEKIKSSLETLVENVGTINDTGSKPPPGVEHTSALDPLDKSVPKEPIAYHTVNKGETIYSISKKYGLTVGELKEMNHLPEDMIIYSGQKLRIRK